MKRAFTLLGGAALACSASACAIPLKAPPSGIARVTSPSGSWARVLERRVDAAGRIDFGGLYADSADLDDFLAYVARVSPDSHPALFPTPASRIAFALNAHNAWAMKAAAASGFLPENRHTFFRRLRAPIGGRRISLRSLGETALAGGAEPRSHFALCSMARGSPRLARRPYDPALLDSQLEAAARRFLNDEANVQIDESLGIARLSTVLRWAHNDILARSPSVLEYINRFRDRPIPPGSRVVFLPFDWSLDRQPERQSGDTIPISE